MSRVASLGMYDAPGQKPANDRLWAGIADRLRAAGVDGLPDALDRSRPLAEIWDDPDLLLAQTCGYPLMTEWRKRLTYVATPRYGAPGCEGTGHRSRFVVHADSPIAALQDCRGLTAAVNDPASNTGMNLLRAAVASLAVDGRFFGRVVVTGSHAASLEAVAGGEAAIAAIDGVSFAALERERADLTAAVRTIGWSEVSPALPFVTSINSTPALVQTLRRAIRETIAADAGIQQSLWIEGVEVIAVERYEAVLALEHRAARAGYPKLA